MGFKEQSLDSCPSSLTKRKHEYTYLNRCLSNEINVQRQDGLQIKTSKIANCVYTAIATILKLREQCLTTIVLSIICDPIRLYKDIPLQYSCIELEITDRQTNRHCRTLGNYHSYRGA